MSTAWKSAVVEPSVENVVPGFRRISVSMMLPSVTIKFGLSGSCPLPAAEITEVIASAAPTALTSS